MEMDMAPVTSSTIDAIGYDAEAQSLRIRFKSGACYEYAGVPPETHAALMAAESKGRHMHHAIKPTYKVARVTVAPQEAASPREAPRAPDRETA